MRAIGLLAMAALFCSAGSVLAQDVEADFGMDVKELAQAQKDSDEKGIGATVSELARARGEAASNRADAAATVAQAHSIREAVATARAGLGTTHADVAATVAQAQAIRTAVAAARPGR